MPCSCRYLLSELKDRKNGEERYAFLLDILKVPLQTDEYNLESSTGVLKAADEIAMELAKSGVRPPPGAHVPGAPGVRLTPADIEVGVLANEGDQHILLNKEHILDMYRYADDVEENDEEEEGCNDEGEEEEYLPPDKASDDEEAEDDGNTSSDCIHYHHRISETQYDVC